MRFVQFRRVMARFPVFSLSDIRMVQRDFDRRRLSEWQEKGYIEKIVNRYYRFADIPVDDAFLFRVANKIYSPSYISFESVLSEANLIPETVHQVTSAATRKTVSYSTRIGVFSYRTLNPRLYFGYDVGQEGLRVATLEKAILDYLYLHPELKDREDIEALRVDPSELKSRLDLERFEAFLARFDKKALVKRATGFLKWVHYA
ncbi:MAG: hypothetical protein JXR37_02990 [Kiritimatiellae bacterium]|nr:hypothetical protein [Kiritimatiellia bacterium]